MEQLTGLGETIISTPQEEIKLDRYIKNVLAFKPLLARIFSETITECKGLTYEEIERCIEGELLVESVGIDPGMTNCAEKISGQMQESTINGEGTAYYDIRTYLRIPYKTRTDEQIRVKILVNLEAQKDDTPGYDLVTRGIFYCSRMISEQLSTEFTNKSADKVKYGNLKKVYSIWICTETTNEISNTIERYRIQREVFPMAKTMNVPRFDLLEVVQVNLSENHEAENTGSEMIRLLTELFDENIEPKEKIVMLKEKYGLETTIEYEREVTYMTSYTANLKRKGHCEGRQEGITVFIKDKLEDEVPVERIIEKLMKYYQLKEEEAREWIDKCRQIVEQK